MLSLLGNLHYNKMSLLYRATRDGWEEKDFHQRCDNQGPTITLLRPTKKKSCIGGFTNVPWSSVSS